MRISGGHCACQQMADLVVLNDTFILIALLSSQRPPALSI